MSEPYYDLDFCGVTVVNHREIWKLRKNGHVTFHVTKIRTKRNAIRYTVEMWSGDSKYVRLTNTKIRPAFTSALNYILS